MNRLFPTRGLPVPKHNGKHPHVMVGGAREEKASGWNWYPSGQFWGDSTFDLRNKVDPVIRGLSAYALSTLAYACMRFRATKFTEARVWVKEETTKDGKKDEVWLDQAQVDRQLAELLERPNPDMEMADLLELTCLYLDGTGACLWVKNRDRSDRVVSLYPYSADEFSVEPDVIDGQPRLYGKFRVQIDARLGRAREKEFGPDDVVFHRNIDPRNLAYFISPTDVVLSHLNIGEQMKRTILGMLRRAIRPGSLINFEQTLSDEERARYREMLEAYHAGYDRAGRFLMLEGKVTFEQLAGALKDLELGPIQGDIEAAICQGFQIRPELLGAVVQLESGTGFADSLKPALTFFYDLAMFPMWERIGRTLTRSLLREVDDNPLRFIRFDTTAVRSLQLDMTARTTEATNAGKYWTVNERRTHTGLEPLPPDDERGEELDSAASPFGSFGDPLEEPDEEEELDEELDEEEEEAKAEQKVRRRRTRRAEREGLRRRIAWAVCDAMARTQEMALEIASQRAINDDRERILAIVTGEKADPVGPVDSARAQRIRDAVDSYLKGESPERWRVLLRPILEATSTRAAERAASELGVDFNLLQPGLLKFIEKETGFLITHISETTRDGVKRAIAASIDAGEGVTQMAKRIQEAGEFSRGRATLIARTESTRATNGAARESMSEYSREYGVRVEKEWLTARDTKVRDEHAAMEGERVAIDEPFSNGLQYPSEPNCRCTLLHHTVVDEPKSEPVKPPDPPIVNVSVHIPPAPTPKATVVKRTIKAKRNAKGDLEGEITEVPT